MRLRHCLPELMNAAKMPVWKETDQDQRALLLRSSHVSGVAQVSDALSVAEL